MARLVHFSLVALLVWFCRVQATVLTYNILAHDRPCFFTWVDTPNKKLGLYFAVQSGGSFDIDFEMTDPQGKIILNGERERQGDYVLNARHVGEYALCFTNDMSTFAEKLIDFELLVEDHTRDPEKEATSGNAAANANSPAATLEDTLYRIGGTLTSISRAQKFLRTRENRNASTVASTEQRIFWFASLESIAIVSMAALQVLVIRGFFSQHRRGGV
ncbi:emp24/gp25L/p24 family/GOLD-domain-containing protein [Gongronella butleri]|nr:emp24/gp25L/p24 family/GOLD-domain-containing protein [Gongronella butleri]